MSERPILFSAPMVRAILAGTKTQTRRAVRPVGNDGGFVLQDYGRGWWPYRSDDGESPMKGDNEIPHACPYGLPGDRLWVRETWGFNPDFPGLLGHVCFRADRGHEHDGINWRPSIHMPRAASRITLEVTGVRVERLQSISEADAIAEGVQRTAGGSWLPGPCDHPEWAYHQLWDQINGDGAWAANPWVWAVSFRVVKP